MRLLPITVLLFLLIQGCSKEAIPEKYQMRGAWIATVKNIDWPSKPGLNSETQREEFRALVNSLSNNGINALFVQVRPTTDAFYPDENELWSEWLTGTQGQPPTPSYDPLSYMIETTHNAGMEFHAWFNPYRAIFDADSVLTDKKHITNIKPGWFLRYGNKIYFDPGIPEVREYLIEVIGKVCEKYKVDAIHFDDYFYPYKIAGEVFPDSISFIRYGKDFKNVDDWRRDNVNRLVQGLDEKINDVDPKIKFGISPFGVWRNKEDDPMGSNTKAGQRNYDDLYADVLHWLKMGWIDYNVPQLYWHIGFDLADYSELAKWWSQYSFNRHLYIGQAVYRIGSERAEEWQNPSEMPRHLRLNKEYPEIKGDVYFSSKGYIQNKLGINDTLRNDIYKYSALVPPMPWLDNQKPQPVKNVKVTSGNGHAYLTWDYMEVDSDIAYVLIYRKKGKIGPDPNDMKDFLVKKRYPLKDFKDEISGTYTYVITTLDRTGNESIPSQPITVKVKN